jgi:hypothetical protein
VCRIRTPEGTQIERFDSIGPPISYLRVTERRLGMAVTYPVSSAEQDLTEEALQRFLAIHQSYRRADPGVRSILVCGGRSRTY